MAKQATAEKRRRRERGSINPDDIIKGAFELAEQVGIDNLSMPLLGKHLGGATGFPRGLGVWRDDAQGGRLVWDQPALIQCYTSEAELEAESAALHDFLIELGTATNQGAVGFVIDRDFYEIEFPLGGQ